jgi:rsbT co-antagonist protein RsbR
LDHQQLITHLQEQLPRFGAQVAERLIDARLDSYSSVPREQLNRMTGAALAALLNDISQATIKQFPEYWQNVTPARAEAGAKVEDMIQAITIGLEILNDAVVELCGHDVALHNLWLASVWPVASAGTLALAQIFTSVRERIIRTQEARIRELSTPIIPLYQGVLALPLVGSIDSHRAGQIMESLLVGISEQQADVVIIDITGVPVVDTSVANYLLQSARAARLLGTQIILVGISAEVAQTITQLGADLSGITTLANLALGIQYALALQGLAIAAR